MAGGVPPSPTEGFEFSTRSRGVSQSCPSMNTCVHKHTELHCEYTVLYACMCDVCKCVYECTHPCTHRSQRTEFSISLLETRSFTETGARLGQHPPHTTHTHTHTHTHRSSGLCLPQCWGNRNPCSGLELRSLCLHNKSPYLDSSPDPGTYNLAFFCS